MLVTRAPDFAFDLRQHLSHTKLTHRLEEVGIQIPVRRMLQAEVVANRTANSNFQPLGGFQNHGPDFAIKLIAVPDHLKADAWLETLGDRIDELIPIAL